MDNSSIFKPYQNYPSVRGDKQRIIKNSIGRQLPYIVNFKKSTCQVFDIELERITHAFTFPDGCQLVDVDYFPTKEGQFGIIVGVEDKSKTWGAENFVIALTTDTDSPTMRITNTLQVPSRITTIKTLYSNVNIAEGIANGTLGLYHRLLTWQHIVAIGCKRAKCFVTNLPTFDATNGIVTIHTPKKGMIDLLSCYVDQDILQYTLEDGAYRDYPATGVYVSALALMPRSRTLLVGLSMGGILAAALNPSNQMNLLELRQERLIKEIAPLEPEDDPDKFEYFIAAVDRSSRHPIMIQLWRGSFKSMDEVNDHEKYDRPQFSACLEHKIPYGERWLAINPIVTERGSGMECVQRHRRNDSSMDSMLNVSQMFGCTSNRSHVFMAYERKMLDTSSSDEPIMMVEAAIFDIDAWYYKRVPGRVVTDGTVLRQCPFMSCIRSDISSSQVHDIGILTLDSTDMSRFASMTSDSDQLFYPSAVSYDRVFVADSSQIKWMKIQNIQETILNKCASKLPWIVRSPDPMAENILAAGLVRKNILTGSPNSSAVDMVETVSPLSPQLRIVLSAMIYYGKIEEFCNLIARHDLSDKIKVEIAEWAMQEAVEYKRIISDRTVSLFEGLTMSLSPLAEDTVHQGIKLFRVVHEYLKKCSKIVKEGGHLQNCAHSLKCMQNHTKLVSRFINFHIVPVNHATQTMMRQMHDKRKTKALKNKTALPIQIVTRNMHRLAANAQFWNEMPHDEWYPPTPLDLLESILNLCITERIKRELIVQYVLDWLRADPDHSESTDKQLALEVIKVMTNQMLDVDLEKIYYVLDQERFALKQQTTISLTDDEGGIRKKVFSLEDDGLTYEQLWSGEVHMASTIKPTDLERFEQRMGAQEEKDSKKKLSVFDPETEKLYQVFLFENQKYDLMSKEAIESHQLLSTLLPGMIQKSSKKAQKSAKEREIERSVKEMFERQAKKEDAELPEVYATLGDKTNGGGGSRKRRSEAAVEEEMSPVAFVPPTAKRIPKKRTIIQHDTMTIDDNTIMSQESSDPTDSSSKDTDHNALLNKMIATPARYYKRPATAATGDLTSPTHLQRLPPVPQQNSILKTAKAFQSPSRGRIRFHASVRKGANESIDSVEDIDEMEKEPEPAPEKPNFGILEEEEETPYVRRSSLKSSEVNEHHEEKGAEPEPEPEPEPVKQYEVLEDCIEEETFELQDGDEEGISGNLESYVEQESVESVEDEAQNVEKLVEESEKSVNKMDQDEEKSEEKSEKSVENEFDDPVWDAIEHKEAQNAEKLVEEDLEESEKSVEDAEEKELEALEEELENEFDDPVWDGIERSFEVQKDEDCEPKTLGLEQEPDSQNDEDELREDVQLEQTFEHQEEEEEPKPRGDLEESVFQEVEKTPERAIVMDDVDFERPPSANTRSRTQSRCVTPVDVEKKEEEKKEAEPKPKARQPMKTRAASVQKTMEIQEEAAGTSRQAEPKVKVQPSKTRAASVQKTMEIQESDTSRSTRGASVQKIQKTSEIQEVASVQNSGKPQDQEEVEERPVSRSNSRIRRANSVKKDQVVEASSVKRATPRSRMNSEAVVEAPSDKRATPRSRLNSEAAPEAVVKAPSVIKAPSVKRATPRSRLNSEAAPEATPTTSGRLTRSRANTPSRAISTAPEEPTPTPKAAPRGRKASTREVTPPTDETAIVPNLTGSSVSRRVNTRLTTRANSVIAESTTPVVAPASTKRATTSAKRVSVSAPTTPRRGRQPKVTTETTATTTIEEEPVAPATSRGSAKRRTPDADDTPQPAKKPRGRPRATPLKVIPESVEGEQQQQPEASSSKSTDTPKRGGGGGGKGRSRTNSTSSTITSNSVPTTPKRGRKATMTLAEVVEEQEEEDEQEEEETATPVRRSARRLQQQKP